MQQTEHGDRQTAYSLLDNFVVLLSSYSQAQQFDDTRSAAATALAVSGRHHMSFEWMHCLGLYGVKSLCVTAWWQLQAFHVPVFESDMHCHAITLHCDCVVQSTPLAQRPTACWLIQTHQVNTDKKD